MPDKPTALWKRILGYSAFVWVALFINLLLTFPYEALSDTLRTEVEKQGLTLRIGSLGPGFFAVKAKNLELAKKSDTQEPNEPLKIDAVSIGPTLFPPGIGVTAKMLGGTLAARVSGLSANKLRIDAENLDLSKGNVKGYSGIDFAGSVGAHVDLVVPTSGAAEPDLTQLNGTISIETQGLTIKGGTLKLTLPPYPDPTPYDLPPIVLGDVSGKVKFEKGVGTVSDFSGKSSDLELQVSGTLKVAGKIIAGQVRGAEYSEPNLEIRLKPDPGFPQRLGPLGMGLSMIAADPKDPTWRKGTLTGYLNRPSFR